MLPPFGDDRSVPLGDDEGALQVLDVISDSIVGDFGVVDVIKAAEIMIGREDAHINTRAQIEINQNIMVTNICDVLAITSIWGRRHAKKKRRMQAS